MRTGLVYHLSRAQDIVRLLCARKMAACFRTVAAEALSEYTAGKGVFLGG